MLFIVGKINVPRTNFTPIDNYHLRDNNLSLKAIGLFDKMLSLHPDWDYSIRGLTAICKESINTIQSIIKELEDRGYLERIVIRDEKGRFLDCDYILHNYPCHKNRDMDNRDLDFPDMENYDKLNTNKLSTKELNKKNIYKYYCPLKKTCHGCIDEACRNCFNINQCPFPVNQERIERLYGDSEQADIQAMQEIFFSNENYDIQKRDSADLATVLEERFRFLLEDNPKLLNENYRKDYLKNYYGSGDDNNGSD